MDSTYMESKYCPKYTQNTWKLSICVTHWNACEMFFSMWCKGEIDRPSLEEMLIKALRHSLCDYVCEYYAFTAPLCEAPPDLAAEAALSIHEENLAASTTGLSCRGCSKHSWRESGSSQLSQRWVDMLLPNRRLGVWRVTQYHKLLWYHNYQHYV